MSLRHFVRFNVAGALGIGVQLASFAALLRLTSLSPAAAASLAVVLAVIHNFFWHWKWTWADRRIPARTVPAAFLRFAAGNGAVSLVGTALAMPVLTNAGVKPLVANLGAIAACGVLNFCLAATVAFRAPAGWPRRNGPSQVSSGDPAKRQPKHSMCGSSHIGLHWRRSGGADHDCTARDVLGRCVRCHSCRTCGSTPECECARRRSDARSLNFLTRRA